MNAILFLQDSRMAAEDLQDLTAGLLRSINQETDLTARLPEERGGAGTKGDAVTIGQIVIVALSSGTVVALLQVLKSYLERKPTLEIELVLPDKTLKMKAEHFSPEQLAQTMQAVQHCLKVVERSRNHRPPPSAPLRQRGMFTVMMTLEKF